MMVSFNNRLRQVFFLLLLLIVAVIIFKELYIFFPGFLGALALYILSRKWYFYLTDQRSWHKSLAAAVFILVFLVCIATPVYFSFKMLYAKSEVIFENPRQIEDVFKAISVQIKQWTGQEFRINEYAPDIKKKAASFIPRLLNGSALMVGNLLMIVFLSFFMFVNGKEMESAIRTYVPLQKENFNLLATETKMMVTSNAVGIPLVSIIQGVCALTGYWIFGIEDFVVLGFVTGIFAFFPIVGTAVIWLPLVIYLFSSGENGKAIGLMIYSLIITGNIDYVARVTFLKKTGNVHPVVTILGLIVGLRLFGFWGFIFGPLLISYFLLLMKIYKTEYGKS
jgi:predicted PurR-regulated permease PerM